MFVSVWSHLAGVCQLCLLYLCVELKAEFLQLDGMRGLETLSVLLQSRKQALPLCSLLKHTNTTFYDCHSIAKYCKLKN